MCQESEYLTWFTQTRAWRTHVMVPQVKFREYLALSDSFLIACIEQGSTDMLPVVRKGHVDVETLLREKAYCCLNGIAGRVLKEHP